MKHKNDAKDQANKIMKDYISIGNTPEQSIESSIIAIDLVLSNVRYGTETHSLIMRTKNYLNSLKEQQ